MQWNIGFHVNLKYIICTACFPVLQLQNIRLVLSSMYRAEITTDPICSGFPFFKMLFVFCVHLYYPPRKTKHVYKWSPLVISNNH